jgi:hypothetical protein
MECDGRGHDPGLCHPETGCWYTSDEGTGEMTYDEAEAKMFRDRVALEQSIRERQDAAWDAATPVDGGRVASRDREDFHADG